MDEQEKKNQQEKERQKASKNTILTQILTQEAMGRLNSISLVKPEKADIIESVLIQMAQRGAITGKLEDTALVNIIQNIQTQIPPSNKPSITVIRKRQNFDSDEDY